MGSRSNLPHREIMERLSNRKEVDQKLPLLHYCRSAGELLKQANVYRLEDNSIELYVRLARFISMMVETVPLHKDFNKPPYKREVLKLRNQVGKAVEEAEKLKPTVQEQVRRLVQQGRTPQQPEPQPAHLLKYQPMGVALPGQGPPQPPTSRPPPFPSQPPRHDVSALEQMLGGQGGNFIAGSSVGAENNIGMTVAPYVDNAVAASQPYPPQPYPSAPQPYPAGPMGMDLLTGPPSSVLPPYYSAPPPSAPFSDPLTHSAAPLSSYAYLEPQPDALSRHSFLGGPPTRQQRQQAPVASGYRVQYPSYIDASPVSLPSWSGSEPSATSLSEPVLDGPSPPPLQSALPVEAQLASLSFDAPPPREPTLPPAEVPVETLPAPVDVQPRPEGVADPRPGPPTALTADELVEQKGPKNLHFCHLMMEEFMRIAAANTRKNLETCAVLAGRLKKGTFYVTTLVIPKQEATSDSCNTVNEEEIFDAQDKRGLFQLGWIHTHPTQTCFMSSVDLHTHYSYQVMLSEAIAIVMAPTDNTRKFGVFRLSDPGGVRAIQNCQRRGFHPHESPGDGSPIYQHCDHVYMNPELRFDVIDLRKR